MNAPTRLVKDHWSVEFGDASRSHSTFDAVRGLAALLVAIAHGVQVWIAPVTAAASSFTGQLATWSVATFFVLSGIVIADSAKRRCSERRFDWCSFMLARFLRIMPTLWAAAAVTVLCVALIRAFHLYGAVSYRMPGDLSIARDAAQFEWSALLPTITLSFGLGFGHYLTFNGPLWTLAYEWWLYVFAACVITATINRSVVAGAIALALLWRVGDDPLWWTFGAVWGIGFAVGWWRERLRDRTLVAVLTMAALSVALIIENHGGVSSPYADLAGRVLYIAAGALIAATLALAPRTINWVVAGTMAWLSRSSYTLYLLHFPILLLCFSMLRPAIASLGLLGHLLGACVSLCAALAASWAISLVVENRRLIRSPSFR